MNTPSAKTAIVIGATGLVGSELVQLLLEDTRFEKVIVFVRRSMGISHPKLMQYVIDFGNLSPWKDKVKGDVFFSSLGTTLRQAGSKEAQYKVDYTYQYDFAEVAARNGVPVYVLISSYGADTKSMVFYSRIKGELEEAVKKLPFKHIHIIQPGQLKGERKDKRPMEKLAVKAVEILNSIGLLKKYDPIEGRTVAQAMINASFLESPLSVHALEKVYTLAGKGDNVRT